MFTVLLALDALELLLLGKRQDLFPLFRRNSPRVVTVGTIGYFTAKVKVILAVKKREVWVPVVSIDCNFKNDSPLHCAYVLARCFACRRLSSEYVVLRIADMKSDLFETSVLTRREVLADNGFLQFRVFVISTPSVKTNRLDKWVARVRRFHFPVRRYVKNRVGEKVLALFWWERSCRLGLGGDWQRTLMNIHIHGLTSLCAVAGGRDKLIFLLKRRSSSPETKTAEDCGRATRTDSIQKGDRYLIYRLF